MNPFSSIGYGLEGVQNFNAGEERLRASRISNDERAIGLENLQREDANQKVGREAYSGAVAAGGTPEGSLLDMSNALARHGDMQGALQARQLHSQLRNAGIPELVDALRTNDKQGDRPDVLPLLGRIDKYRDAKSAQFDGRGNLTIQHANGTPEVIPVHTLGLLTGQFTPYRQVVAPGSSLVQGTVGDTLPGATPGSVIQAPPAEKFAATRTGTIYDQATGAVKYEPPDDTWTLGEVMNGDKKVPVSFSKKTGQAVILGPGGNTEKAEIKFDNMGNGWATIGGQVFKVNPGTPGSPGSSSTLGFGGSPATPGTPPSMTPITQPPAPDAKQAGDGNWYRPDPANPGKYLKAVAPGSSAGQPAPVQAPRPASVPPEDEAAWRAVSEANAKGLKATAMGNSTNPPAELRSTKAEKAANAVQADATVYTRTKNPRGGYSYTPSRKIARGGATLESGGRTMAEWAALDSGQKVAAKANGGKVTRYGL